MKFHRPAKSESTLLQPHRDIIEENFILIHRPRGRLKNNPPDPLQRLTRALQHRKFKALRVDLQENGIRGGDEAKLFFQSRDRNNLLPKLCDFRIRLQMVSVQL